MFFKLGALWTTYLLGALAIAVATVNANIAQRGAFPRLNPALVPAVSPRIISQLEARSLTNAKRLVAGLPLKAPYRRATKTSAARRSDPSGVPTTIQGYIEAFGDGNHFPEGYISNVYNAKGVAGLTRDTSEAMIFSLPTSGTPGPISILTTNGHHPLYPYFGGIKATVAIDQGNIGPGNSNFLYLGGTIETSPGPASSNGPGSVFGQLSGDNESIGSAIWLYDPSTNFITPQWVNSDLSTPTTIIGYTGAGGFLFLTGDLTAFEKDFEVSALTTISVYFNFVPLS